MMRMGLREMETRMKEENEEEGERNYRQLRTGIR